MSYSTFLGTIAAIGRANKAKQRQAFVLARMAHHADKNGAKKLMKGLDDEQ